MQNVPEIVIKNRPLVHYLLCLLNLIFRGNDQICLKAYGSLIGKATDILNLFTKKLLPETFATFSVKNNIEEADCPYTSQGKCSVSASEFPIKLRLPVPDFIEDVVKGKVGAISPTKLPTRITIFDLELLLAVLYAHQLKQLKLIRKRVDLGGKIPAFDLHVGVLDFDYKFSLGEDLLNPKRLLENPPSGQEIAQLQTRVKKLEDIQSSIRDALMRCNLLRPDLEPYKFSISQWDDVIFGLDTNLFHWCACTSFLLDSLLKIPSGDFVDTPDWMTLVLSKVVMAELEHQAARGKETWESRQALRGLQEIMVLNRSKDLEGVSFVLTGNVPPEVDFSSGMTRTVRDFLIRDHFRAFLKQLDFYKGSYFVTGDFDNATLAEAEGLASLYIQKPELESQIFQVPPEEVTFSEILYELTVSLEPLSVEAGDVKFNLHSMWPRKSLQNWERWELEVEWEKDNLNIRDKFEHLRLGEGPVKLLVQRCQNLKDRFVAWVR